MSDCWRRRRRCWGFDPKIGNTVRNLEIRKSDKLQLLWMIRSAAELASETAIRGGGDWLGGFDPWCGWGDRAKLLRFPSSGRGA